MPPDLLIILYSVVFLVVVMLSWLTFNRQNARRLDDRINVKCGECGHKNRIEPYHGKFRCSRCGFKHRLAEEKLK